LGYVRQTVNFAAGGDDVIDAARYLFSLDEPSEDAKR
jgi:hypothetical protein